MKLTPRDRFLLIVLALMVPVTAWRWIQPFVSQLATRAGVSAAREIASPIPSARIEIVRLSDLEVPARQYSPNRDIFRLGKRPAPPPPKVVDRPPPVTRTPPPPPPPVETRGPQPPSVDVKLLGIFGPEKRRVAVFKDKNGPELFNVLVDEVLRDKFRVTSIGYQSVELGFEGFPDVPPARLKIGG